MLQYYQLFQEEKYLGKISEDRVSINEVTKTFQDFPVEDIIKPQDGSLIKKNIISQGRFLFFVLEILEKKITI